MKEKHVVVVTGTREPVDEAMWSHQRTASRKRGFTRNRTCATTKNTPFPLPETHMKATANDVRDLSCVEKKGKESNP
jgi:hypothetical protein